MKSIKRICIALVIIVFAAYFSLRLVWYFQPKHIVNILILDKTVTKTSCPEHSSLIWILNNLKVVKPDKTSYTKTDYIGFFPIDTKNDVFDFKSIRINEIETFASTNDMAYYTDCYGVYTAEWYKNNQSQALSTTKVYGGLNQNDYLLLKRMKDNGKVIIGEYNMLGSPTNALIRNKAEELFNLTWTSWTGKSYSTLNTNSSNGPAQWMPALYESQHLKPWPKDKKGIVLVNNEGLIDILILDEDINSLLPTITLNSENKYNLPQETKYNGWFEISLANNNAQVLAQYNLDVTDKGATHLEKLGLTNCFPAIIQAHNEEPTFYFNGDFAHNKNCSILSKIQGGRTATNIFCGDRVQKKFFTKFYFPLIEGIITDYCPK